MTGGSRGSGSSKLTKLKSVLKKWHSLGKQPSSSSSSSSPSSNNNNKNKNNNNNNSNIIAVSTADEEDVNNQWHAVYVGKSRRRYHISSEVAEHPVFQELLERSGDRDTVHCEVVLFEHLLWMLENATADHQPESLQDLVDLYAS